MLLLEPRPTAYDLHFHVAGIPVRVHPLFWLAAVLLGGLDSDPRFLLIWVPVVFSSVLVHELGHALTMRRFGQTPRIVLYMMGGFATTSSGPYGFGFSLSRSLKHAEQVLVLLAGPGAGFLLAAVVLLLVRVTGGEVEFVRAFPVFYRFRLAIGDSLEYPQLYGLVHVLVFVNVFWGLINLVPVYPLDGGQIARELCVARDPWQGVVYSLWISLVAGTVMVVVALKYQEVFLAILFGLLAVQSYQALQQSRGGWRGW